MIDAVTSFILFQRVNVFCRAVKVAEMYAVIQVDIPVGGEYHSSVRELEYVAYLVVAQSLCRVDRCKQEVVGVHRQCHPDTQEEE